MRDCKKESLVLHYIITFSVSYFSCTNCALMYLYFLVLIIKNSVKLLNKPGMVLVGIWLRIKRLIAQNISRNVIIIYSISSAATSSIYMRFSESVNQYNCHNLVLIVTGFLGKLGMATRHYLTLNVPSVTLRNLWFLLSLEKSVNIVKTFHMTGDIIWND